MAASVLVHIGWPKTGTTWLQEKVFVEALGYEQVLSRDDVVREFVLPDHMGFDSVGVREQLQAAAELAERRGLCPVVSHERLAGVLRNRLESVTFAERLVDSVPGMRVLVVVREQRAAMLSAWQQYVRGPGSPANGPSVRSLSDYYGSRQTRFSTLPPLGEMNYFEYDRLVSWYRDRLGPEHVLVLPLEMLRKDPDAFQRRVHRFGRGERRSSWAGNDSVNTAWAPVTYAVKRRLNYIGDRKRVTGSTRAPHNIVMNAAYKFDAALPSVVRRVGRERNRALVSRLAGERFVGSNRRLADLVDWDPGYYGYMV